MGFKYPDTDKKSELNSRPKGSKTTKKVKKTNFMEVLGVKKWVLKTRLVCNLSYKLLRPVRIYWQKIRIKFET